MNGNGTLNRAGNGYIAHPTTIGKDVVIRVTASVGGRTQSMGDYTYRVRQLPDPSPFIEYTEDGTPKRYRGGRGLSKAILMNTPGIVAAIDDGLLNINFRVLGFETVFFDNMGNAVPEVSSGLHSLHVRKICSAVYPEVNVSIFPGFVRWGRMGWSVCCLLHWK